MVIVRSISEIKKEENVAVAVGAFDSLHLGHQRVISALHPCSGIKAIFTFEENPAGKTRAVSYEDKLELFKKYSVDIVYSIPFNEVKNIPPQEFVQDILIDRIGAKRICCGEDFRFGRWASGDVKLLDNICSKNNVELKSVSHLKLNGKPVSTTRIREAVMSADVSLARELLGRPFGFKGEVIYGNQIGVTMGTPTINQRVPQGMVLPRFGVYASIVEIDKKRLCGVTNIGVKPTVGSKMPLYETWILDFNADLYGQKIRLNLMSFIRGEKKFNSLDELKQEILSNAQSARRAIWSSGGPNSPN